jgi:hypothetical protein
LRVRSALTSADSQAAGYADLSTREILFGKGELRVVLAQELRRDRGGDLPERLEQGGIVDDDDLEVLHIVRSRRPSSSFQNQIEVTEGDGAGGVEGHPRRTARAQ